MSSKRVLITGGAGFLGSHLCDHYVAQGWDVLCADNLSSGRRSNIAHLEGRADFRFLEHDVTEPIPVDEPLDLVLHFASPASPPFYKQMPIETLRVGSTGTERCLDLAVAHGARFVLASTSEIYGDPQVHPQTETYFGHVNTVGPRSMYDESKRYAEALVTAYQTTTGVDAGLVRIFNTYGPRMRADDGRVVTTFLIQILNGIPLTIHGDGTQTRSFCYVDDLIAGITAYAAGDCRVPVNLGNASTEMSIRQLAERLCALFGRPFDPGPKMDRQDEDDPMRRCPDLSRAKALLGWEPVVSFEDGMRKTAAWLQDS